MIKYDRMFQLLEDRGYTVTRIKEESILGQRTYYNLKKGIGGIDYRTINKLCALFDVQPNDLMEYVPDEKALQQ